jgi:hypothetical protein
MKIKEKKIKQVEWLNADVMHKATRQWLSELTFIKDEQEFFDDLVKNYTLQMIDSKHFEESKKVVNQLSKLQKKNSLLIKGVKQHEKKLSIITDGINQLNEEAAYKDKHRDYIVTMNRYFRIYRTLKSQLFDLIKKILKEEKQKRLLN